MGKVSETMFSEKQIQFMLSIGLNLDFYQLKEEDYIKIEDAISESLQISGFDAQYNTTEIGKMCESILDKLS